MEPPSLGKMLATLILLLVIVSLLVASIAQYFMYANFDGFIQTWMIWLGSLTLLFTLVLCCFFKSGKAKFDRLVRQIEANQMKGKDLEEGGSRESVKKLLKTSNSSKA